MNPLVQRIEWILRKRGISQRELARRSGLNEPHVGLIIARLKKEPTAGVEHDTLLAIAKGGGVSPAWLLAGEGTPEPGEQATSTTSEPTAPAPTSAELHEKPDTHWTTDEVEEWFLPVLQAAPKGHYKGRQVTASKMFVRDRTAKLKDDADMVEFAAGVLEAARALDEANRPLTNATILHYLAKQNLPDFMHPKHDWQPGDKEIVEKARAEGLDINPDDPPEVRKARRKARLAGK